MKRIVKHRLLNLPPIMVCIISVVIILYVANIITSNPELARSITIYWCFAGVIFLIDFIVSYIYIKELLKTELDLKKEDKKRLEERIAYIKDVVKKYQDAIPVLEKRLKEYENI